MTQSFRRASWSSKSRGSLSSGQYKFARRRRRTTSRPGLREKPSWKPIWTKMSGSHSSHPVRNLLLQVSLKYRRTSRNQRGACRNLRAINFSRANYLTRWSTIWKSWIIQTWVIWVPIPRRQVKAHPHLEVTSAGSLKKNRRIKTKRF